MAPMGNGYGSEFHLLRYLGRHRHRLNQLIENETHGTVVDWLDFGRHPDNRDAELRGLEFIDREDVKSLWRDFWPQSGNTPNWDAVGILKNDSSKEYVLVEAKAHVEELQSTCGAHQNGGLAQITKALDSTIKANSFEKDVGQWLSPYYQYANRLAHLQFLLDHGVPARLIFVYFIGDKIETQNGRMAVCPATREEWGPPLQGMYRHLGLDKPCALLQRVHAIYPPV